MVIAVMFILMFVLFMLTVPVAIALGLLGGPGHD